MSNKNKYPLKDEEILNIIYKALDDKFGEDIKVIDITEHSKMTDYFVITSGNSPTQVKALADEVIRKLKEIEIEIKKSEGYSNGTWILLDFDIVIVHIFNKENREFYNLEKMWDKGKFIDLGN